MKTKKGEMRDYNYYSHTPKVLCLLQSNWKLYLVPNYYRSCKQQNDLNSSEMSIDEHQHQLRKQMSIEEVSPSPLKRQKEKVHQNPIEMKQVEQVEEIPHIQTRRKANKTNYNVDDSPTEEDDFKACHCSKTHCLQLYCSCFHNRRPCTNECKCNDCFNDGKHEDEVIKAVEQIKLKEQRASHHDLDSFDTKQVWGCKCKKTKCVKGYCECFIRGKKCTSHCQCTECENKRQPKQHKQKPPEEITKQIKKKKYS
ncbi:unnamed protein product (macronuclear) [Paramecium tetraurelia]|uniref:CRC domain-containing protein n=1 Tax=Paramecium tetraurelia TaxID=5888 RepID=A0C2R8_PARTE|nr:uncharacterized protein GSPATT00034563001 [Paramecium tetraurelia]CAK65085.1 unnamed protein product [Paramecium tetraurelia]|eukprot:XP_001432482.1 hypothetical protein (macronuclear) [Paramecium tetraurelia strain d4-2]